MSFKRFLSEDSVGNSRDATLLHLHGFVFLFVLHFSFHLTDDSNHKIPGDFKRFKTSKES